MFITAFLKRIREQPAASTVLPHSASVDIELPLGEFDSPHGREVPRRTDLDLSPIAHLWLAQLPSSARPRHLCDSFPRIANRLALCWREVDLVDKILDDLLVDRRGGRRGFPTEVTAELLRLHSFHEHRRKAANESSGRNWDRHLQASADR